MGREPDHPLWLSSTPVTNVSAVTQPMADPSRPLWPRMREINDRNSHLIAEK